MKKLFFPIALLLMFVVGCKHTPKTNEVEVETYTLSDSLYMENEYEEGYSHYTANLDLPVTNNDTLRLNILHWMLSPETEDYKSYFENDKNQFFSEEGSEPRSEIESNYTLAEQTDRYITYISEGFIYTGGAHPVPWYYGATFSKKDGSLVGYDMFNDIEQLTEIIAPHFQELYFNSLELVEEMEDMGDEDFILPINDPWIETDSVVFCYQTFEIAPYSAGMPLCKISKTDLLPYLSEKGKSVLFDQQ